MNIKPKLYLNESPQTAEEASLAFARNMRIDDDGNLTSDYGYLSISENIDDNTTWNTSSIVGHIIGLDNKIYFLTYEVISDVPTSNIYEYDELTKEVKVIDSAWSYSGGKISGYVNTNISGEKILTIAEVKANSTDDDIPIKHINLSYCSSNDNESIYTQTPEIPIANITLYNTYVKTIPNGVYVFFIRYEIRSGVYTNWFLASRPIFGGVSEKTNTIQGGLKYINLHKDSAKSFILDVTYINETAKAYYNGFQIGFIISHDEATDARIWKSFKMTDTRLYFDYDEIQETNIDDLTETTYRLTNVGNVTNFKNKLYIANYDESNFNPDIADIASKITLNKDVDTTPISFNKNITFNGKTLVWNNALGYYDKDSENSSIASLASTIIANNVFDFNISNFSKGETTELDRCVRFDLRWSHNNDPDLATIHNIYTTLYDDGVFGPNVDTAYGNGRIGIVQTDYDGGVWVFGRHTTKHTWDDLGLTFIYGSVSDTDVNSLDDAREGVFKFKTNTDHYNISGHSIVGWISRNVGFDTKARSAIDSNIKSEVEGKSCFGKFYAEITSGTKVYKIGYNAHMDKPNYVGYAYDSYNYLQSEFYYLDLELADTLDTSNIDTSIQTWTTNIIKQYIVGIDENGTPILSINGDLVYCSSISFTCKRFKFSVESEEILNDTDNFFKRYYVSLKTTEFKCLSMFTVKNNKITVTVNNDSFTQSSVLMPRSVYQPYLHLIDKYGVITNGYKLPNTIDTTASTSPDPTTTKLKYSIDSTIANLDLKDYKGFFISLDNVGDVVMELFGYMKVGTTSIAYCLELDTMLYTATDNITIVTEHMGITDSAKYYPSSTVNPIQAFGNCGYVAWESGNYDYTNTRLYIKISRSNIGKIRKLTKATPYLPLAAATNVSITDGFYGGYLCIVKKPTYNLSSNVYVAGTEIFGVNRTSTLTLNDYNNYIQLQNSMSYVIRSNFNLNYLSLTEDLNDIYFSVGSASSGIKQLIKVINSATLSYIYELKAMYKDFFNKTFIEQTEINKTRFDNTIRVSNVLSDETFNNSVFKFEAKNYYNIPTDRGIVISLFAIGNMIYAHTEASLYKFNGNQTIMSSDKDIALAESDPFTNGIEQVIDSQYGYGGIVNKEAGCITFESYVFYDQNSNRIFAYNGNSQLLAIDAPIRKLLSYYKPKKCVTVHDEVNHRILFEFTSGRGDNEVTNDNNTFCISFNYKSKSFVSLHDLTLQNSFNSKYFVYSYINGLIRLFEQTDTIDNTILNQTYNIKKLYGNATIESLINYGSNINTISPTCIGVSIVMFPKTSDLDVLNSVEILANIQDKAIIGHTGRSYNTIAIPLNVNQIPIQAMFITTDVCTSTIVNTAVNDTARPNTLLDYKGFKYDKGKWTSNYFRNAINNANIYDYPNQPRNDQTPNSDNNSLVYGRYFVINLFFKTNKPIKIESIDINSKSY